jgi:hypothetical protein
MRHKLTSTLLLCAALAGSAGLSWAQGGADSHAGPAACGRAAPANPDPAYLDGTGAGLNAGPGARAGATGRDEANGSTSRNLPPPVDRSTDTGILGNTGSATSPHEIHPTVGINGTGTLDGSVAAAGSGGSGRAGATGGLDGGVQR